jgi:2-C-methyl-D-erythritol 4-phosphate cytidylyltransferase
MNVAIIVAAGSGTRFGGDVPKQFLDLGGKPLLIHTLERFENCPAVDRIVLVLPPAETGNFSAEKYHLTKVERLVAGGRTRAESVYNGLLASAPAEVVAVHDGARPFVSGAEISAVIERAAATGAACLVAPVTDTIKRVVGDRIVETIDRAQLRRALTPQCFRYELLVRAFENADLGAAAATDECYLVEKTGAPIATVEGSAKNVKITTREDLLWAEKVWRDF